VEPTIVLFPSGALAARARVVAVEQVDRGWAVMTDVSPFHPLDHTWPDQPADAGTLAGMPVVECLTGAAGPDGRLRIGADIPVRRGEAGYDWVVVHLLERGAPPVAVGDEVELSVDPGLRASLSAAHTACHLAALALNRAAADLWRKDAPRSDSLGAPDLDGLTIAQSRILPLHSIDTYRLGRSIRKKGLDTAALIDALPGLQATVTQTLRSWIASGSPVRIDDGGDRGVAARRTWRCDLPEGAATYPCGGTHVRNLAELPATARVEYRPTDDGFVADTLLG